MRVNKYLQNLARPVLIISWLITLNLSRDCFAVAAAADATGLELSNSQVSVRLLRQGKLEIDRRFSIILEFTSVADGIAATSGFELDLDPPLGVVLLDGRGQRRKINLDFAAAKQRGEIVALNIPLLVTEAVFPDDLRIQISTLNSVENKPLLPLEFVLPLVVMNQEAVFDINTLSYWSGRAELGDYDDSGDLRYRQLPENPVELNRAEQELTTYAELFKTLNPELNNYLAGQGLDLAPAVQSYRLALYIAAVKNFQEGDFSAAEKHFATAREFRLLSASISRGVPVSRLEHEIDIALDNLRGIIAWRESGPAAALEIWSTIDAELPVMRYVYFNMALAELKLKNLPRAKILLEQVLQLNPDFHEATRLLRRL